MKTDNISCKLTKGLSIIFFVLILTMGINSMTTTAISNQQNSNSISFFYTPHTPIKITHDDNFTHYGFPGEGTSENPYIIEGYNITSTNEDGICVTYTTKHFVIKDCYIDAYYNGIFVDNVANGTVTIINNTCINNYYGICLESTDNSIVENNSCSNNEYIGIQVSLCSYSAIINNTCNNLGWEGVQMYGSSFLTVTNNTLHNNDKGVTFWETESCVFSYNYIRDCYEHGIFMGSASKDNIIHNNAFVNNNLGGSSQGYDDGVNNTWYDPLMNVGNYWNEWIGTGNYAIDGSASSVDLYPLGESPLVTIAEFQINYISILTIFVIPLVMIAANIRKKNK